MVKVAGKPILEHTIDLFKKHGIEDVVLALCYLPEKIESYFSDGSKFGIRIRYTYEDINNPLGTAGAILDSREYVKGDFIVTYADILRELDVGDVVDKHRKTEAFATLNVYKRFGENPKSMVIFVTDNRIL